MPISGQKLQCIKDNPNLSASALSSFLGIDRKTVERNRESPEWKHNGKSIPFMCFVIAESAHWQVQFGSRMIHRGSFVEAINNVDRLIYCLENNSGKLPRTLSDVVLGDLEFINANKRS
jgi:hypothetical protein